MLKKYLLDKENEVLLYKTIKKIITSEISEETFVFTKAQNKYPEMSSMVNALKAMLTPDAAQRSSARECLEILEGPGSSSKAQITSPQITFSKTEILNGGMGSAKPVPQNQYQRKPSSNLHNRL
jgi:hypothetical protein